MEPVVKRDAGQIDNGQYTAVRLTWIADHVADLPPTIDYARLSASEVAHIGCRQCAAPGHLDLIARRFVLIQTLNGVVVLEGHHVVAALVQWRGQVQRKSLKLRLNAELALTALESQAGGVSGAAIGLLGQSVEPWNFFGLAHAIGGGLTLDSDERVGLCAFRWKFSGSTIKFDRATQELCVHAHQAETRLIEIDVALGFFKQRQGRLQAHIVVVQADVALHGGFIKLGQGEAELEARIQSSCALSLCKQTAQHVVDGRLAQVC